MRIFWYLIKFIVVSSVVINAFGFIYLFFSRVQLDNSNGLLHLQQQLKVCGLATYSKDVVLTALQLGRLDVVSILLAILGAIIAIFGLVGFWMIRREALEEAKKQAKESTVQSFKNGEQNELIRGYVEEYLARYSYGQNDKNDYNKIAASYEEENI